MDRVPEEKGFALKHETGREAATVTIEQMIEITNPEIAEITSTIVDTLGLSSEINEEIRKLWAEYARRVESFVDSLADPKARTEAQIAAIINKGLVFQLTNDTARCLEELDTAEIYAANEGFSMVAASLDTEIKNKVELLDLSPEKVILKLRGIIDESNRNFLRDLLHQGDGLEDIINHAYGMILDSGEDPDEVLASLGLIE